MSDSNQNVQMIIGLIVLLILGFGIYHFMIKKEGFENATDSLSTTTTDSTDSTTTDSKMTNLKNKMAARKAEKEAGDAALMTEPSTPVAEAFSNGGDADSMMMNSPQTQQLTATDLLPNDNSSQWAQIYPTGEGSLKDRNFLQAGYHIGINTVGQTLRNANLQLRSEPPAPQVKVSPWLQSTIEPDLGRKPFEIGGCA